MSKQNITISVDSEIIKKAKVLSAKRMTSVSRLLGRELERLVAESENYEKAKKRALSDLKKGFHFGGRIVAAREKFHKR
ncbi:MAG TPA: hypothetical protein PLR20_04685 [Syntrophales bacterium]|jgi:hypothetical protein|nr:hypothetical protein [Syntrophales bacterium]HPI56333.1 hypothetical protein [Syntrophales bacterium]HPN24279.1 hypothetical protein [Syntrophales bacterium]HQM28632.1 hypothetical protein [Syntrophales bacterium]